MVDSMNVQQVVVCRTCERKTRGPTGTHQHHSFQRASHNPATVLPAALSLALIPTSLSRTFITKPRLTSPMHCRPNQIALRRRCTKISIR